MHFDPVAVAAVNATVLGLVLAGTTGYAIFLFQGLHQMRTALIESANQINDVESGRFISTRIRYDPQDAEQRRDMCYAIMELGKMGGPSSSVSDRGWEFIERLSLLFTNYPFPQPGIARKPKTVALTDEGEIQVWAVHMAEIVGRLSWFFDTHHHQLVELLDTFEAEARGEGMARELEMRKHLSPGQRQDIESMTSVSSIHSIVDGYIHMLKTASQVVADVRTKLSRIHRYRARLPSRKLFIGGLVVGGALFCCGVFLPLINPTAPALFVAWIPGLGYLLGLLVLIAWVVKEYQPGERGS